MAYLDIQKRIEFLEKLRALLKEYDASIEVVDAGNEYEGHLTVYSNDVHEIAEFGYNVDITADEIDKELSSLKCKMKKSHEKKG